MAKKQGRERFPTPQSGAADGAGASFDPSQLPEEEATAPEAGAIPLGLPISAEEYRRQQRQARNRQLPPKCSGQEDTSA